MKTNKDIKAEKNNREWTMMIVVFCYFFAAIFTCAATLQLLKGNIGKGFVGLAVIVLTVIFAEKVRRRNKITLAEIKNAD